MLLLRAGNDASPLASLYLCEERSTSIYSIAGPGLSSERRPTKVAAVALANKIARMAIMVRGERYKEPKLLLAA
jgi:hypothetical protein